MNQLMREQAIVPVILCGGSGSRLWPVSREDCPKQFLNILGNNSLLQNTLLRAKNLPNVNHHHIVIVTTAAMEEQVRRQAALLDPNLTRHIIIEPLARNTAPAIAFATTYVLKNFGSDSVLCIMPSDHHIEDTESLHDSIVKGFSLASDHNIITFGIKPVSPHTEYGYMICGDMHSPHAFHVKTFQEKPPLDEAKILYSRANTFWNSGIFMLTLQSALYHFRTHAPSLYRSIIMNPSSINSAYQSCGNLSFDHEIMEKSSNVLVIPADLQWTDVGSWESLWAIYPKDKEQNVLLGKTVCFDSEGCFIQSHKRLIAVSGMKDIVIVETEDAIFVSPKKEAGLHKKMAHHLIQLQENELEASTDRPNPWSLTGKIGPEYIDIAIDQAFSPESTPALPCFYIVLEGIANYGDRNYGNHELLIFLPGMKQPIKNDGAVPLKLLKVNMNSRVSMSSSIREEIRHAS